MRTIRKGPEPTSLTEYRLTPGADYENYADKDTLREYLVREQRGLCCYCLSRIRPERSAMKVEHWHCQANYRAESLQYSNLLGACMGGEGEIPEFQHCDTRKQDSTISKNPANLEHRVEDTIRYLGDGRIESTDPTFDGEVNNALNLNSPFLINNRKSALNSFAEFLAKKQGTRTRKELEKQLLLWNGESETGDLKPFCQVVVYYLRKRLARG